MSISLEAIQRRLSNTIKRAQERRAMSEQTAAEMYVAVIAIAYMFKKSSEDQFVCTLIDLGVKEIEREVAGAIRNGKLWSRQKSRGNSFMAEAARTVSREFSEPLLGENAMEKGGSVQ
jgi:hypothetical protein